MSRKNDSKRCAGRWMLTIRAGSSLAFRTECGTPAGTVAFSPARTGRRLPFMKTVHEDLERALDDLVALLSPRVHVNGRARHPGLDPIRGLEQLAGGVGCAARDLPPHSQPGTEVEPAIVTAGRLARCGFAVVKFGHGGPFPEGPAAGAPSRKFGNCGETT